MQKINDLHNFIVSLNLVEANQIDSFVDDLVISPAFRRTSVPGKIVVAEKSYTAIFNITRYPHGLVSEDVLLAQISSWLMQNDTERNEPIEFPIIVDVHDSKTADIEFGILFTELIEAVEDAAGSIDLDGVKYALL